MAQAAAVLAATKTIVVGIGILPAGARNAAFAAMELATLAQLFPGRIIAGLGHGMPGWMRQAGAWPSSPLGLLEEFTHAVRALLSGVPGPAAGRFVNVAGVVLKELPDAVPPIVLGVRGPKSLALTGKIADGVVLAEPATPRYVADSLANCADGADLSEGGLADDFQVITYDVAAVHDDPAVAIAAARRNLGTFGEPDWAPHIVGQPFALDLVDLRQRCASPQEFATLMPAQWVSALTLAGSVDQVKEKLAARHAAGTTTAVLIPIGEDRLGEIEQLARVLSA
ncbi:LLM class flavin-dependent oxidoreductase [Jonesiaceae bacterium BS-20]|uniref:LLM class flavin-dependent oxidoreductase n=1 Tax=Jonesiaceae bacterium BS-20 TaxID=3120821 RepID=A0AAU7DW97_9MICO